uniref:(California timema) hypothetical protein n=1 Tax=Timema californicum TaxID=61474 RepID=A0A7R9J3E8_TIMCA|nr:unnamed protein product [Timema californicum]
MDMSLGANTTMEEETEMDTEIDFPFDINDFEVIDEVGEVDYFKNDSSDSIDLCDDKEYSENVLQLDKALACEHIHSGETLAKNKDKSLCYNTLVHMKSDQTTPLKQNVPVLSGNSNKETPAFVKEENYISTSIVSKKETLQPASRDLKNKTPISQSNTLKTETAQPFSRDSKNATLIPANGASNKKRQPASRDSKNETPITASEVLMEANTIRLDINLSKELCNLSSTVSSKKIVTDVHGSIKGVCSPHVVTDEKTPHLKKEHMLEEKTFADSSAGKKISPTTGKITKKESKVEKRNEINTKNRGLNKRKREMEENKSLPKKQKQDEDENAVGLQWQKTLPEKRGYFMTCIDKLTTAVRDNYREYLDNYREYRHWFEKNRRLCPIVDTHLPEQKILCQKCILRAGVEKNTGLLILGVRRKMFFVSKPDRLYYAPPVRKVIKACQELVKTVGKPVFDAVKRKGFWQSLLIRCNEAGDVLVQVDLHAANQKDADTIFKEMNYVLIEFFSTGSGKDCNVKSLYLKIVLKHPGDILPYKVFKHRGDILPYKVFKHPGDIMPYKVLKDPGDLMPCKVLKDPGDLMPCKVLKHAGDILPYKVFKNPGDILPYKVLKHPGDILLYEVFKHPGDILPYEVLKDPGDILPYEVLKDPGDILPYKVLKDPGDLMPCKVLKHPGDKLPYKVLKHPGDILPYKVLKHPGDILPYKIDLLSLVHLGEGVGSSSNMASSEPRAPVQSSADFVVKCISGLL